MVMKGFQVYIYIYVIHVCMVAAHLGLSKEPLGSCTVPKQGLQKSPQVVFYIFFPIDSNDQTYNMFEGSLISTEVKHRFLIHQLVVWHDAWIPNFNKLVVKSHTQAATIFPLNT